MFKPPQSPLDRIQNLQWVPTNVVDALEKRLRENYVPKILEQVKEDRLSAEALRSKVLY